MSSVAVRVPEPVRPIRNVHAQERFLGKKAGAGEDIAKIYPFVRGAPGQRT